jgi:transposase-like protein
MEQQQDMLTIRHYSEAFKRQVIEEYMAGGVTQAALQRKYNIGGNCAILNWRRKLGHGSSLPQEGTNFPVIKSVAMNQKKEVKSLPELQQRIKELERQLEDEKLRAEMYERIIDKAEKELKIPIRKKPNTR